MKEVRRRICQNWIWIELRNLLKILDTYPPTQDDMTPILPISKLTVPICIISQSFLLIVDCREIHPFNNIMSGDWRWAGQWFFWTNKQQESLLRHCFGGEPSRVGTFETSKVFLIKNVLGLSTYKMPSIIKPLSYTNFFSWQSFRVNFIAPISLWVSDFNEVITYCNSVKILNFVI